MSFKVGDKVKFINETLTGTIQTIISDKRIVVRNSDGFSAEVAVNKVIIIKDDASFHYINDEQAILNKVTKNEPLHKADSTNILSRYLTQNSTKSNKILEIDLHLEELVEFPQKLADWQKLHTQMQHVKKCLNAAFDKNVKKIIFIHGVGTGVLKTEVRNYLSTFSNLTVSDADSRAYGKGATKVIIKIN